MNVYDKKLTELFRTCIGLRSRFIIIEREADRMREMSMNASVVAGQTGSHMRVFNEIAQQITITARRAEEITQKMRSEVNHIVNLNLQALTIELRLEKFVLASTHIQGRGNQLLVSGVIADFNSRISELMLQILQQVQYMETLLKSLSQNQCRTFAALNALKVEAISLHGSEFSAIAMLTESLAELVETDHAQLGEVSVHLRTVKNQAQYVENKANKEIRLEILYAA